MDPSAALILSFPDGTTAASRDWLVSLLADAGLVAIHEDDPVKPSRWTAHFVDAPAREAAAARLRASDAFRTIAVEAVDIADEDWARRTQRQLCAVEVGRMIVAPPWDLPGRSGAPDSIVIEIEPSRGFGTGHHQSTRLVLLLLQARDLRGRTMVDVGTGSGVLAIAGARLGAAGVEAIDVDPDAVENAAENIERNGVSAVVQVRAADVACATVPPADLVTANLTSSLLEQHAGDLQKLVKPGGALIASGFTCEEADRVASAFAPAMTVVEAVDEDGWRGLVFTRPAVSPTPR